MLEAAPRVGAVVLAGGRVPASLAAHCAHRALLPIHGRPMLAYVVDALHAAPSIAATVAVLPEAAISGLAPSPCPCLPAGETIVENMQRGARALAGEGITHLLFVTGDIPLLTGEAIEAYLAASHQSGAALTYPIIPQAACEERFPGARRTYVRLAEGTFTGGNAIFTTARLLDDKEALIRALYEGRKQPLKLAQILGWQTVVRLLLGTLALPYVEGVAERILGAPVRAIITPYPEIGFDVDKIDDLTAVVQARPSPASEG